MNIIQIIYKGMSDQNMEIPDQRKWDSFKPKFKGILIITILITILYIGMRGSNNAFEGPYKPHFRSELNNHPAMRLINWAIENTIDKDRKKYSTYK